MVGICKQVLEKEFWRKWEKKLWIGRRHNRDTDLSDREKGFEVRLDFLHMIDSSQWIVIVAVACQKLPSTDVFACSLSAAAGVANDADAKPPLQILLKAMFFIPAAFIHYLPNPNATGPGALD